MSIFPVNAPIGSLTGITAGPVDAIPMPLVLAPGLPRTSAIPPLVLLHGIQGTAASWQGVIDALPADVPVIAPNLRGRAGSPVPETTDAYGMTAFAADLEAVLSAIGQPAVLVGWSMGVLVALCHARDFGHDRLRGLVLLSGSPSPGGEGAQWFAEETRSEIEVAADARARNLGLVESAAPVAVAGAWMAARKTDCREVLPRVQSPTLVIHGTEDDQCPYDHGLLMAEHIPHSRMHTCTGGPHNLLSHCPGVVAEQLAMFHAEQCCRA